MRLSDLVRDQAPDPREDVTGRRSALPSPLPDTKDPFVENVSSLLGADAHGTWYGNARKEMAAIGEAVRANREMTFDRCHRLAEDLVTMLATSDDLILRMMREDAEAYQVSDVPPS